jgi:hypothetical protein
MPLIELKFSVSDAALPILDKLRDSMSRDQFFRHALELGLCEILEDATRMQRDHLTRILAGNTNDYKQGRAALLSVSDPDNATPQKS